VRLLVELKVTAVSDIWPHEGNVTDGAKGNSCLCDIWPHEGNVTDGVKGNSCLCDIRPHEGNETEAQHLVILKTKGTLSSVCDRETNILWI
jgi:hypothetical protein